MISPLAVHRVPTLVPTGAQSHLVAKGIASVISDLPHLLNVKAYVLFFEETGS